jgi:hypothetical protein
MNIAVCLEPYNGIGIWKKDTGLGNRLVQWTILHYISTLSENCKLLVQQEYWPELEFLSLPNTQFIDTDSSNIKEKFLKLSSENIKNILDTGTICCIKNSDPFRIYSDEFYFPKVPTDSIVFEGIKKIKFKKKEANQFFRENFSDCCSIHLRRGSGTIPSVGFIKEYLSNDKENLEKYVKDYIFNQKYYPPENYLIIPDSVYFSIIDQIISDNKNQKIYISSDISEDYYNYYFKKYPDNVFSKQEYLEKFLNLFEYDEIKIKKYKYSLKQTLVNLFDLFILSYSKTLIVDDSSTWSFVASLIHKEKEVINAISYTMKNELITYDQFKSKYRYYKSRTFKNKLIEKLEQTNEQSGGKYTLLDIIKEYWPNDDESDMINFANQIYILISSEKIKNDSEYSTGWNDCIKNLLKNIFD